jgi:hypothetical protein
VETGSIVRRLQGHTNTVSGAFFTPDGSQIVSGSFDHDVVLWDVLTGEMLRRFEAHTNWVYGIALSRDGLRVLSASRDATLILWRIQPYPGGVVAWAQNNRYAPELTCEQRIIYRIQPACDVAGVFPTRTPYPTLPPTPTLTPTPTVDFSRTTATPTRTPQPTPTLSPRLTGDDPAGVVNSLAALGFVERGGRLGGTLDSVSIDQAGEDNSIRWERLEGSYGNFVMGTTIEWGPGAIEDYCGFLFRESDSDNYYTVQINRQDELWFNAYLDGEWQDDVVGNGDAVNAGADDQNTLVLVATGTVFTVFVNGEYAARFDEPDLPTGEVALLAGTEDESDETGCTFRDAWVWALESSALVTPTPGRDLRVVESANPDTVLEMLVENGVLSMRTGFLGDEIPSMVIDLSDKDDTVEWNAFEGEYSDFVVGATVRWGAGASEDQCGIVLRDIDDDNLYLVAIDRRDNLTFDKLLNDEWQPGQTGDGGAVRASRDEENTLVIVGIGDTFTVYINGEFAQTFTDSEHPRGEVALMAGTFDESEASSCTFTNAWVWDLNATSPPPTPTPTATPADVRVAQAGDNMGEVRIGGGQLWKYGGTAGEVVTIRVTADDARTFDSYLILRAPDGTLLAENDDIVVGEDTNSLIEAITLPGDGVYQIEVRSFEDSTGGTYTLTIETDAG